jgi:hypothetical protein
MKIEFGYLINKAPSFHLLEENSATLHYSLLFKRRDPYKKIFFKKLDQLFETGWIQWMQHLLEYVAARSVEKDEEGPRRLSMDHLGVCFLAITACLSLTCLVFIIERFAGCCKK